MSNLNNIQNIKNLKIKSFLNPDKKSIIASKNTSNVFVIGNKGNKVFVFNYNLNEEKLIIESFNKNIIHELSNGNFSLNDIKVESYISYKDGVNHNKDIGEGLLVDTSIDFPPSNESYKYYFHYASNKCYHEILECINDIKKIDQEILDKNVLQKINIIEKNIKIELSKDFINIKGLFLSLEELKLNKELLENNKRFIEIFDKDELLDYFKIYFKNNHKNITNSMLEEFFDNITSKKEFDLLKIYSKNEIFGYIKKRLNG